MYGVSAWTVGVVEALCLIDAALHDTGTELFAAVAGWSYPASRTDLLLLGAVMENASAVMPWAEQPDVPTEAEVAEVNARLLSEIRFAD